MALRPYIIITKNTLKKNKLKQIKFIVGSLTFHAEIYFIFNDLNYFIFID